MAHDPNSRKMAAGKRDLTYVCGSTAALHSCAKRRVRGTKMGCSWIQEQQEIAMKKMTMGLVLLGLAGAASAQVDDTSYGAGALSHLSGGSFDSAFGYDSMFSTTNS